MIRNDNPSYRKKGLSVFLAVIMVLSVVAMSAAFVGSVAASEHDPDGDDVAYGPSQIGAQQIEITFEDSAIDLFEPDTVLEDNFTVWNYADEEIEVNNVDLHDGDWRVVLDLDDPLVGGAASVEFVEQGENVSIETASVVHDLGAGSADITPFAGEQIAITNPADVLTITHPNGERERGTGANSTVYVLDTSEWSAGDEINVTDGTEELDITLRGYDIDVETDQDEYTDDEEIEVTAEADRVQRDMVINLYDEDDERVAQQEETSGPTGVTEVTFDASGLEGDYYAVVYDQQTWISGQSDEFSVEEFVTDRDAWFGDVNDQAEGDIIDINLEFDDAEEYDDEVHIWINESDYSAELALDLDDFDDDSLVIEWNTYYAGGFAEGWATEEEVFNVTSHDNASVSINTETPIDEDFRLNPSGYTLGLFDDGGDFDNRIDSASVTVTDRHTGDATVSIAPSDVDHDNIDEVLGNTTDFSTVAENDTLVIEQEVSGIFGYGFDDGSFAADAGLSASFNSTDAPAYAPASSFTEDDENVTVHYDQSEHAVWFVVDVPIEGLEDGDTIDWEFSFNVSEDNNAYIEDEDDEESASASYTVTERAVELGLVESPYQVVNSPEGEIRGDSTLAPGSNVTVSIDMPGVFFSEIDTVQVDGDRNWAANQSHFENNVNFSDYEVGDEFEITWSAHEVDEDSEDAIFADVPEWETVTGEQQLRNIVDQIKALVGADDDDGVVDRTQSAVDERNELRDEVDDLQGQIADLEAELADAVSQEDYDAAQDEIANLQSQIDDLEADLQQAQDDADDYQSLYEGAQDTIDDLNDEIDDLEAQLDELQAILDVLEEEGIEDADQLRDRLDDAQPAFGPIAALFALLAGGALIARRRL